MKESPLRGAWCPPVIGGLLFLSAIFAPAAARADTFREWLLKKIGHPGDGLIGLSKGAGCNLPHQGQTVRRLRCDDNGRGQESVLWKCDQCSSPVPVDRGDLAVLRSDGIWRLPKPGKHARSPHREVAATGIASIFGGVEGAPSKLVIFAPSGHDGRPESCWIVDLTTLSWDVAPQQPDVEERRLLDRDPGAWRAAALADGRYVHSRPSDPRAPCAPRLFEVIDTNGLAKPGPFCPAWSQSATDGVDRFDPVWMGADIVYVAAAPPPPAPARPNR